MLIVVVLILPWRAW